MRSTPLALYALAIGAFGIGVSEMVIAGLLPQIAAEFDISIAQAGHMATSYALGVFFGAPLLILIGREISRKPMMIGLMGLFVVGSLLTCLAPNYTIALSGRVVTSLSHGAFFGIGSILAAALVAPNKRVGAIAFMIGGFALATLVGVPVGTWVGQIFSWRASFLAITMIGLVALLALLLWLPADKALSDAPEKTSIAQELAAFKDIPMLLAMGITVLGVGGFFTSITYIAPMMIEVAGFREGTIVWLMLIYGIGVFLGNILSGRYGDRALMSFLFFSLLAQALVLFIFTFVANSQWASLMCILLMGAFGFACVSPIQKLVMDKARGAGAPTLAAAVNIGMFNLGNALGAWAGGYALDAGFGLVAPNWVGGCLASGALILALLLAALDRCKSRSTRQKAGNAF